MAVTGGSMPEPDPFEGIDYRQNVVSGVDEMEWRSRYGGYAFERAALDFEDTISRARLAKHWERIWKYSERSGKSITSIILTMFRLDQEALARQQVEPPVVHGWEGTMAGEPTIIREPHSPTERGDKPQTASELVTEKLSGLLDHLRPSQRPGARYERRVISESKRLGISEHEWRAAHPYRGRDSGQKQEQ
jgi:hypothetical protein